VKSKISVYLLAAIFCLAALCSITAGTEQKPAVKQKSTTLKKDEKKSMTLTTPGIYATFETSLGNITCQLFEKEAPVTVANFIGLAEGTKEWTDPKSGQKMKKPFYNGLIFHRVIPNFMIQGGCPLGMGTGGPGYQFKDECVTSLGFDKAGRLAMANSGPGTNGSQFFITVAQTTWLNNKHTIFGQVTEGQDVMNKISNVSRGEHDKPIQNVVINKLVITRVK